jgi:hypothetical protein
MKVWQRHIAGRESLIESLVQRIRFSAKNPHLHKAQARYLQGWTTVPTSNIRAEIVRQNANPSQN